MPVRTDKEESLRMTWLTRALTMLAMLMLVACAEPDKWPEVERRARAGDAHAELELGLRYRDGKGIPADPEQARHWLELSAEHHQPLAKFYLGELYMRQHDAASLARARDLFESAHHSGITIVDDALANLLATNANSNLADGEYAVSLIEPALRDEGGVGIERFEVLAAAYARAGRYAEAVGAERHAVADVDCKCRKEILRERERRLATYQRGETWNETLVLEP